MSIGVVTMSKTVLSVSMRFALAAMIALCNPMLALADTPAGSAKGVNPAASADLDGATRTLTVGSDIFIGDDVITGPQGQVQILFADNTKLVVGPNSALKMQDYLLRNDGGNRNHWLSVRLEGVKSNRSALGAVVTIESASGKQSQTVHSGSSYLSQSDLALTFGLAKDDVVKAIEIRWPSGRVDKKTNIKANQFLKIREGQL